MNNEDKPITSRRERRRAQASSTDGLPAPNPAQARAEQEARAAAEARGGDEPVAFGEPEPENTDTARLRARRALDAPLDAMRAERSSQARARDREAHRVMRELAEKGQAAQFPSRRSLRQQSPEPGGAFEAQDQAPAAERNLPPTPLRRPSSGDIPAQALPVLPAPAPQPEGEPQQSRGEAPSSFAPGPGPQMPARSAPQRQAPVRQAPDGTPVLGPETGSFSRLTHEQIAAARELLKEQAKNQSATVSAQGGEGDAVDPEVLKQQVAVAEREAILNRRAQARQRLAEETRRDVEATRKTGPAPTAANNLAMVTPLEYMKVPGLPHPVMKPPSTTHVPVVTDRTPAQRGHGRGFAREATPISAVSAHGLDPLGPQTSRANRERILFLSIGALGIVALIAAILIVLLGR